MGVQRFYNYCPQHFNFVRHKKSANKKYVLLLVFFLYTPGIYEILVEFISLTLIHIYQDFLKNFEIFGSLKFKIRGPNFIGMYLIKIFKNFLNFQNHGSSIFILKNSLKCTSFQFKL